MADDQRGARSLNDLAVPAEVAARAGLSALFAERSHLGALDVRTVFYEAAGAMEQSDPDLAKLYTLLGILLPLVVAAGARRRPEDPARARAGLGHVDKLHEGDSPDAV